MTRDGVLVTADDVELGASLEVPSAARGLVLFAHGSGRHGPRNRHVARTLHVRGFATLLVDLLTPAEAQIVATDAGLAFDVEFLADRLVGVTAWAARDSRTSALAPCYFGAGTAGAVAVIAAARWGARIGAVVSRGGRLDLAATFLPQVRSPTLLIVGAADIETLAVSRPSLDRLGAAHHLAVVSAATRLFSEPGALDEVADLTAGWFLEHVDGSRTRADAAVVALPPDTQNPRQA